MKTLYLDCSCGISGDMAAAALLSLGAVEEQDLKDMTASLHVDCTAVLQDASRNGIAAKEFLTCTDAIDQNASQTAAQTARHSLRSLSEICDKIDHSILTPGAKEYAKKMFEILAGAESAVHKIPKDEVHFHEVGSDSSVVDLCAAAMALDRLRVGKVCVSPLKDGSGEIRCAHGVIPVPVPATLEVCRQNQVPLEITDIDGEMVTPTGAAFVAAVADEFTRKVSGTIAQVGYGAGQREFPNAGVVRAILTESAEDEHHDSVLLLETNIDDCVPEVLGYAMEKLMEAGARDVWFTPIYMKKNRPAYLLSVLCKPEREQAMEEIIFSETSSIGLRRSELDRVIMEREEVQVETPYGVVQGKKCTFGSITKLAPEYDSVKALAEQTGVSVLDIYRSFPKG